MAEVSKAVSDRIAITRTLKSAIEVHGAEVADALEIKLFPKGAPPDCNVRTFLGALQAQAQRAADEVAEKDQEHAKELADDAKPRHDRDIARGALREGMIGTRGTLESVYGPSILKEYGLTGETPTDNDELLQAASTTEDLLRNRDLKEKPIRVGVVVDPKAIADDIHGRIEDLRTALGEVRREEREAQVTRDERNSSLIRWNTSYQGLAAVVTGLFELADKPALADRVRPTARRRAGLTEEADTNEGNGEGNGGTTP